MAAMKAAKALALSEGGCETLLTIWSYLAWNWLPATMP